MDLINQAIVLNELEAAEVNAERRPRRIFNERNPFVESSDKQFMKLFRLSKNAVNEFIDDITPFMQPQSRRSSLSIQRKVYMNHVLSFILSHIITTWYQLLIIYYIKIVLI